MPKPTLFRFLSLAMALTLALPLSGSPAAGAAETLRISTDGDYPPFSFKGDDGTLIGFDIDIANALCAAMAATCAIEQHPWPELIPDLLAGRSDAIVASMSITEERKKQVAFTNHYYRTPMQFVARTGTITDMTPEALRGKRASAERNTTAHYYLRDTYSGVLDVRIFPSQVQAEQALLDGIVDLALADSLVMWRLTKAHPEVAFVGTPITVDEGIGIALRPGDGELLARFNQAIVRIRLDGTYARINAKYFPFSIY